VAAIITKKGRTTSHSLSKRERHKALGKWCKEGIRKSANTGLVGELGGFLIPEELIVGLDARIEEESFFHQHATIQPITNRSIEVPTVDPASAASGGSPLLGGFIMYWSIEGQTTPISNPAFATVKLTAKNLNGYGLASRQLIEDGGEILGSYFENLFVKATVFYMTKGFFNGNGVEQPLGIANAGASMAATVTRNAANAISQADVAGMLTKLIPACYPYAWWACSPSAFAFLLSLSGYNPASMLGTNGVLGGRPIFVTETLPEVGTRGDLCLFDPRLYVVGDRHQIEVQWSEHEPTAYLTGQVAFAVAWRGDGQPLLRSTCTLANSQTGAGAYVVLV